ncbi:hypothetical protein [Stenotrophomonas maltophilia]|uniref:Uncharacterized protein n=1 Tax=Stenotrophomonas maltophilia TaxID=40324 RepID=A0A2W6ICR5_STEMA|nr:hypothetical protein [Stenotrophomonas maltophilia]PZS93371.1 hypothetical protein A7X83_06140 [Stenotrophomonas maltophilia]
MNLAHLILCSALLAGPAAAKVNQSFGISIVIVEPDHSTPAREGSAPRNTDSPQANQSAEDDMASAFRHQAWVMDRVVSPGDPRQLFDANLKPIPPVVISLPITQDTP